MIQHVPIFNASLSDRGVVNYFDRILERGAVTSVKKFKIIGDRPYGVAPLPPLGAVTSVSQLQNHWCPHGGAGGGGAVTNNNLLQKSDQ